jgi:hypothetical protein
MARTPTPTGGNTAAPTNTSTTDGQSGTAAGTGTAEGGTGDDGDPDPDKREADPVEVVEVRVTLEFGGHAVNDVIDVPTDRVDQLEREGYVDSHPKAVEYAKSIAA